MSFKEELTPLAQKHKFYWFIKDMDDQEIFEFIEEEIFDSAILDQTVTFEEVREKCKEKCDVDSMLPIADQQELFDLLKKFKH